MKQLLERWGTSGVKFLVAYNGGAAPSARLLFMNISFWLMIASLITLHFKDVSTATWTCVGAFSLCTVFYMFKEINRFKISREEIEIEDTEEAANEQEKS